MRAAIAQSFFAEVLAQARRRGLLSTEHFTVGGTLIEAWASHKSFKRKDRGGERPPPHETAGFKAVPLRPAQQKPSSIPLI